MKTIQYLIIVLHSAGEGAWGGEVYPAEFREDKIIPTGCFEDAWAQVLNHYGRVGWELFSLDGNTATMMRPAGINLIVGSFEKAEPKFIDDMVGLDDE